MSMLATNASAYDFAVKNADSVMIYYDYNNDKSEVAVTYETDSYYSYNSYSGDVVIPKEVKYNKKTIKVTGIGNNAFRNCKDLTSVTIPNSVKSIGSYAFFDSRNLESLTIPGSVTNIDEEAFYGSYITSLTIGLKKIESGFQGFRSLRSVTILDGATSIGKGAFYGCSGLESITIPNSVTSIGEGAFAGWDLPIVISLIDNPFIITGKTDNNRTFSQNTFLNATLYVPKGTVDKYNATDGWKDFVFMTRYQESKSKPKRGNTLPVANSVATLHIPTMQPVIRTLSTNFFPNKKAVPLINKDSASMPGDR
jgi:hypothetical protein